jgi:hypothetical protein
VRLGGAGCAAGTPASFRKPIKGVKRKLERPCDDCFVLSHLGAASSPFVSREQRFVNRDSTLAMSVV